MRFFFRPDETLRYADREELSDMRGAPTKSLKPFTELPLLQILRDPQLDVAAIEVRFEVEKEYPAQFFSLLPDGSTPAVDSRLVLIGFRYDISRMTFDDKRVCSQASNGP